MRLSLLAATCFISVSISAEAAPTFATVKCDSSDEYTCLTGLEDFQVGEDLYNVNFVTANIIDAFAVPGSTREEILEGFQPLRNALFWDDVQGARTFAVALAEFLEANSIDGFLCAGRCDLASAGRPYGYTYIPAYLQTSFAIEVASCFAGTSPTTGEGVSFCYNPGSNTQNWAVISRVPEPATFTLVGLGMAAVAFARGSTRGR